jgi:flavin reductase (DIM6/NTAB) family NADH-FMN oxidoreductase RutF
MAEKIFTAMSLDKWQWSPSPLAHQVFLVTTVDSDGQPNVATKSNPAALSFSGPTYGFNCNRNHRTAKNIQQTGEFIFNVPPVELADAAWGMIDAPDRFAYAHLTTLPGVTVSVPRIVECFAHFECVLDQILEFDNDEIFIIGTVTHIDIDERCLTGDTAERYRQMGTPFFFLEPGWYAPLGAPAQAIREVAPPD